MIQFFGFMTAMRPKTSIVGPPKEGYGILANYTNDRTKAWNFSVVSDSPRSTIIVYLLPLYQTRQSDGRAAYFPNCLTRTLEPLFRYFNGLPLVIILGTTQSFSVMASSHVGFAWCEPEARQISSCMYAAIVPVFR